MTKARDLADFVSAGNPLADGTIDVADINGITATTTEINYTDGVTSNIQTQLDAKADLAGDTMTGDLNFGDSVKANFGAGSDLQIYHDGSASFVQDVGTGSLKISGQNVTILNATATETMAVFTPDAGVSLKYDNATKFDTTSTGVDVTGTITADGIDMEDNHQIKLGTSDDLLIYHDGTNSYVQDNGVGSLLLKGTNLSLQANNGENYLNCTENAGVAIRYNNFTKLETTTSGVTVTGTAIATTDTDTTNTGTVTLDFAANQNFVLTLTGNVTLANPTTEQVGQSGFIVFIQDATGGRTVSLGTDYETAGGAGLTLSSTASTTDVVPYIVVASGRILLGAPQLAFA